MYFFSSSDLTLHPIQFIEGLVLLQPLFVLHVYLLAVCFGFPSVTSSI